MTTLHFTASDDAPNLTKVKGGSAFVPDGELVIAVQLDGDDQHLIKADDFFVDDNGTLRIEHGDNTVRTYGAWTYVERRLYKAPKPARVIAM